MKSTLLIISGFSCTGKTTLAKKIATKFSLPVFGRDDFKESLFNSLGYSDRSRSQKLGFASYDLLYLTTEKILASNKSLIIESNFKVGSDTQKLKTLKEKYYCNLIQIHCHIPISLALARFNYRARSGARHPGHVDYLIGDEMKRNFKQGGYKILDICDSTIDVDTSDFAKINYEMIFEKIQNYLSN
ncbi:MAG: AAA family ATPase [Cyanobacteria bacterium P01_A01_bin.83]